MQQIFINQSLQVNDLVSFNEETVHHIKDVLRMKDGDEVFVVDKDEHKYLTRLTVSSSVQGHIISLVEWDSELSNPVTIAQGLIKGDRWDLFLEKSTEFGVSSIIPLNLKRNVVKIDGKDEPKKIERWQKMVESAAKQSKRNRIPKVESIMNLKDLVKLEYDHKLIAYEDEIGVKQLEVLMNTIQPNETILLVVGAEGGIEQEEVAFLKENGFKVCGLGKRILRAESASLYFLSVVSFSRE